MTTEDERVEAALDTLAEICKMTPEELNESNNMYEKRSAAEEILRHYREQNILSRLFTDGIVVNINGALPVRPMTTAELQKKYPAAETAVDGPHSRVCGARPHDHGTACSHNCPTCGGKAQ